jgi:hypothetical protein
MGRIASTVAGLGTPDYAGEAGFLRVTQGGDVFVLKLYWDVDQHRWVSNPLPPCLQATDLDFMHQTMAHWSFLGSQLSPMSIWSLRSGSIPFAGALFAAGLQLQDRICGAYGQLVAHNFSIAPWFYQFNPGDPVVFDNDVVAQVGKTWNGIADVGLQPSTLNIGHGAVLESGPTYAQTSFNRLFKTAATYGDTLGGYAGLTRNPGWDYVKFFTSSTPSGAALGGVPTTTATVPTKKYLYPTMYAFGNGINESRVAAFTYEVRWTT